MAKKLKRDIISINESKCDGCGNCIISCLEQAIQIVKTQDGPKARLVKDLYCDGLGACLGACPTGALVVETREAEAYDDAATVKRIKEIAPEMLDTHIQHMKEHGTGDSCPGSRTLDWSDKKESEEDNKNNVQSGAKQKSELRQ